MGVVDMCFSWLGYGRDVKRGAWILWLHTFDQGAYLQGSCVLRAERAYVIESDKRTRGLRVSVWIG